MNTSKAHKGDGHRQRLRERFLAGGLSGFHDYEVIELLLTTATPRKDCKGAAKAALKRFKTFQGVLEASPRELCEVEGIGPKNLFGIKLIKAVSERYLEKRLIKKDALNSSKDLFDYLCHSIRDKDRECFEVIYLDAKNRVITSETLFEGGIDLTAMFPGGVPCLSTFIAETRVSNSETAQLDDKLVRSFELCSIKVKKEGPDTSKQGDTAQYKITITNDGALPLNKVSIIDDKLGNLTSECVGPTSPTTLNPGESCTILYSSIVNGSDPFKNTVTATFLRDTATMRAPPNRSPFLTVTGR